MLQISRRALFETPRRCMLPLVARRSASMFSRGSDDMTVPPPRRVVHFGVLFVPQQTAYIVERFGKFQGILEPGLNFLIPVVDKVAYVQSLKVETVEISKQSAVFTKDNVNLVLDGVLYYQVTDAKKASYSVQNAAFAIKQLAFSTMRSEIGQLTLDETLRERQSLNHRMVNAINEAVQEFGLQCLRFEVREIAPSDNVVAAMELQVVAERRQRQLVIESEGERRAAINVAEGEKAAKVLASEARAAETVNLRRSEADGIRLTAEAQASATSTVAAALSGIGGKDAAALAVAQQYIEAFGKLARTSTTLMLPSSASDPTAMIAQAMQIYTQLQQRQAQDHQNHSQYSPPHQHPHQAEHHQNTPHA